MSPLRKELADLLRSEVNRLHKENETAYAKATQALTANDAWMQLLEQDRNSILGQVGLVTPVPPSVKTDEALAAYLDARSLTAMRAEIDAIPGRVSQAIQRAAKQLEPKVQTVNIDRATLRSEADVEKWIEKQKKRVLDALKQGPVLID